MNNNLALKPIPTTADDGSLKLADAKRCRPFLKWAGGKGQLLDQLVSRIPATFNHYYEPFLGGGALFFALQPQTSILADANSELINAFKVVREKTEDLIGTLEKYRHSRINYYKVRELDRDAGYWTYSDVERASRLIYLNKTCFNGLYRVNSRGEFNVPFGEYKNPKIVDRSNLLQCSKALNGARLLCQSFEKTCEMAGPGDFVYLDPPYVPLTETASFTDYSKDGFGLEEHRLLLQCCQKLNARGGEVSALQLRHSLR